MDNSKFRGCHPNRNDFLRVIPTMTHYSDIVSGIPSGSMYIYGEYICVCVVCIYIWCVYIYICGVYIYMVCTYIYIYMVCTYIYIYILILSDILSIIDIYYSVYHSITVLYAMYITIIVYHDMLFCHNILTYYRYNSIYHSI